MSDLISRKALLNSLRGNVLVDVTAELEKTIEEQPTAFDMERVISEMRKEHADAINMYMSNRHTAHGYVSEVRKNTWEKAIKIVEKGGIG